MRNPVVNVSLIAAFAVIAITANPRPALAWSESGCSEIPTPEWAMTYDGKLYCAEVAKVKQNEADNAKKAEEEKNKKAEEEKNKKAEEAKKAEDEKNKKAEDEKNKGNIAHNPANSNANHNANTNGNTNSNANNSTNNNANNNANTNNNANAQNQNQNQSQNQNQTANGGAGGSGGQGGAGGSSTSNATGGNGYGGTGGSATGGNSNATGGNSNATGGNSNLANSGNSSNANSVVGGSQTSSNASASSLTNTTNYQAPITFIAPSGACDRASIGVTATKQTLAGAFVIPIGRRIGCEPAGPSRIDKCIGYLSAGIVVDSIDCHDVHLAPREVSLLVPPVSNNVVAIVPSVVAVEPAAPVVVAAPVVTERIVEKVRYVQVAAASTCIPDNTLAIDESLVHALRGELRGKVQSRELVESYARLQKSCVSPATLLKLLDG